MMIIMNEIITFLEEKFPKHLAYDWDNVGLQIGKKTRITRKIMVVLDVTTAIVDEAVANGVDFIISHHPFIFSPIKTLDLQCPQGKNIEKLIKNDISIYTMHTNYDVASGGMNDLLAKLLQLKNMSKFAMIDDVHGLGRIGELESESTIGELLQNLKSTFHLETIPYTPFDGCIKKVAVIGGSGGKYIHEAKMAGADVLITGDVTHHTAIDASEIGLGLIDIGHFSETFMTDEIEKLVAQNFEIAIYKTKVGRNPLQMG